VVKPYYDAIKTRLKLGRFPALIVVFLSAIIPIAALGWFFGALVFDQAKGLIQSCPGWWASAVQWTKVHAPQIEHLLVDTKIGQAAGSAVEGQSDAFVNVLQFMGQRAVSAGAAAPSTGPPKVPNAMDSSVVALNLDRPSTGIRAIRRSPARAATCDDSKPGRAEVRTLDHSGV